VTNVDPGEEQSDPDRGHNPDWVASYIFQHASGTVAAIPMATGQLGINGQLIHGADSRDYFTVLAH
jgi:hypothetical protein